MKEGAISFSCRSRTLSFFLSAGWLTVLHCFRGLPISKRWSPPPPFSLFHLNSVEDTGRRLPFFLSHTTAAAAISPSSSPRDIGFSLSFSLTSRSFSSPPHPPMDVHHGYSGRVPTPPGLPISSSPFVASGSDGVVFFFFLPSQYRPRIWDSPPFFHAPFADCERRSARKSQSACPSFPPPTGLMEKRSNALRSIPSKDLKGGKNPSPSPPPPSSGQGTVVAPFPPCDNFLPPLLITCRDHEAFLLKKKKRPLPSSSRGI